MLTIWPRACGPYGGESSAICKRSGAMALPPERPPCNQGDRWQRRCCGLAEEIKITFNKPRLEWARALQKVRLSVKPWQLAETRDGGEWGRVGGEGGGEDGTVRSVRSRLRLTGTGASGAPPSSGVGRARCQDRGGGGGESMMVLMQEGKREAAVCVCVCVCGWGGGIKGGCLALVM